MRNALSKIFHQKLCLNTLPLLHTHTHGDPIWKAVGPNYYESIPPRSCPIRQADKTCIIFKGLARLLVRDAVCAACSSGKCLLFTRTMAAKLFEIAQQFETPKWEGKMDCKMVPGWTPQNGAQKEVRFLHQEKFKHIQIVAPHATAYVSSVKIRFP